MSQKTITLTVKVEPDKDGLIGARIEEIGGGVMTAETEELAIIKAFEFALWQLTRRWDDGSPLGLPEAKETAELTLLRAELDKAKAEIERQKKALDQATNCYGIQLPEPINRERLKPAYDLIYSDDSRYPTLDDYVASEIKRVFPYGDATVEFVHSDETFEPENCPELAEILREKEARDGKVS